jgi:hypothetical protein
MQSIPVVITVMSDTVRKIKNEPIDEDEENSPPNENEPNRTKPALSAENAPIVLDKTMSGYYVVSDIKYIFKKGTFRQECFLVRREWPTPPQSK